MECYLCVALAFVILTYLYLYMKKIYSYWDSKGVKGPTPLPIVGNFGSVILQKVGREDMIKSIHLKYSGEKLVGLYLGFKPVILVRDPELVKHVLVKDFNVFRERGVEVRVIGFEDNLFTAEGDRWRIMRQRISPYFTPSKMKKTIPVIQKCVNNLLNYVDHLVENNIEHEMRSLASKYVIEVIGSCASGLNINAYSNEESQFIKMIKKYSEPSKLVVLLDRINMIIPGIRNFFNKRGDIYNFFLDQVRNAMRERERKPRLQDDFMDLLIELRRQEKVFIQNDNRTSEIEIDDKIIAAQLAVFVTGTYESTSTILSFLFYELALNQNVQDRIYNEVCKAYEYHEGISYEALQEMPYLNMVLNETLRKHAVVTVIRKSVETYTFPGTDVTIPKDTKVWISIPGLHADPECFSNPNKFNPDNFSPESTNSVFMPFGFGPHDCIGKRFARIQVMMAAAAFLTRFKLEPSPKTTTQIKYDPKTFTTTACTGGIWVKISKR